MDPAWSSGDGSGDSGRHNPGLAEVDRFYEEIQSLMKFDPAPENSSSFMSLLGLPANQAMELLHEAEPGDAPATPSAAEIWGSRRRDQKPLLFPPHCGCSPTFPSNVGLVERAARFSVFSADDSPQTTSSGGPSNSGGHSPKAVKAEPADADSNPIISSSPNEKQPQRSGKRKEREKSKAKAAASKSRGSSDDGIPKPAEENKCGGSGGEKLPYVHVRARRGQATDNHSLAERARREKINARMKLLQELVPGCSKISGTAMVLDEIINHVQYLQRQVEFLSMRLAAVNRRIDFSGLDCFLAAAEEENDGRVTTTGNVGSTLGSEASPLWPEVQADVVRRQHQPIWQSSSPPPPPEWGGDDDDHRYPFVSPGVSLLCYDPANSVPLHADQLKTEL